MVRRMKSLATFGAGPFSTGDAEGRFGHYDYDDVPQLLAIFFAEFDNIAGPKVKYAVPSGVIKEDVFEANRHLIIPKPDLFCRSVKVSLKGQKCRILGYPIGLEHMNYDRHMYIFNMCFVVAWESESDSMYEPIVQKCAEYLVELEQDYRFLTSEQYKGHLLPIIEKMYHDLKANRESIIEVRTEDSISTLYYKLCPSYRGIEPPEVGSYMVPMFIREVELSPQLVEKMDVLSQKIIPQIDGIRTVKEIANIVELDDNLVARCIRNLHFYECVSLVPMFLYSNTYVATERVHDFYLDQLEISSCLEFVKIQDPVIENGAEVEVALPEFSDVFRLYLSMKCGMKLSKWVREEKPRSMGIDEHRLVQFGMHHQFLRKLTVYPICTVPSMGNALLGACNGKNSMEDISLQYGVDPEKMYDLLESSKKFEFVMK